ncbi:hypothetical protein HY988_04160 [Candidatus Micrarchaeota archaeon]|nr:hypothetical protein [Candidatus Micrarchaeota archaeon]
MTYVNITIRNVKEQALLELKAEAAREKKNLGEAVTEAIEYYVHNKKTFKKKGAKFTDLKPVDFGKGSERWSTSIDEILYS